MIQNDDIWHEMSPPDVLDVFQNHIYYQNMHRNNFGKIEFFGRFLKFSIVGFGPKTAKKHEKLIKTTKNHKDMFLII